jgi:hypothetical protein
MPYSVPSRPCARGAPARPPVATRPPTWTRQGRTAAVTIGDVMIVLLVLAPAILLLIARR